MRQSALALWSKQFKMLFLIIGLHRRIVISQATKKRVNKMLKLRMQQRLDFRKSLRLQKKSAKPKRVSTILSKFRLR